MLNIALLHATVPPQVTQLTPNLMRRDNTLDARRHKQAVRCWQLAGLRKAWATWADHMGRKAEAVQALRRVGMKLHAPALSGAWQSWQDYNARRGAKRVCPHNARMSLCALRSLWHT